MRTEKGKHTCEHFGLSQKEVYDRQEFRNQLTACNATSSTIFADLNVEMSHKA